MQDICRSCGDTKSPTSTWAGAHDYYPGETEPVMGGLGGCGDLHQFAPAEAMHLINLTPHPVTLRDAAGREVTLAPSGEVARAGVQEENCTPISIDGMTIPVVRNTYGQLVGVPAPTPGVGYVVSSLAAQAAPQRGDLFVPTRPVRDEQGRIIAATALAIL